MSPADEQKLHEASSDRHNRAYRGSLRKGALLSDGRTSGEQLDGARATSNPRRTQSSGGFLLDSLPRSGSTRITGAHRARPPEPAGKRTAEADLVVPKKRSRLPWSRHKVSASESSPAQGSTKQTPTPPPEDEHWRISSSADSPDSQQNARGLGLDADSIKIVNLALNLNESRRKSSGLPLGPASRRSVSVTQPAAVDRHVSPSPRINNSLGFFDDQNPRVTPPTVHSPVLEFLPATAVHDNRAFECSKSTLARAERARRHFELFHEYLRLLPLLPPLRNPAPSESPDSRPSSSQPLTNREYNPLQAIRNRRVRYREKCHLDAEREGWYDADKVHDWVDAIEEQTRSKIFDDKQSIKIPPLNSDYHRRSDGAGGELDQLAGSPPASLTRGSQLLADAAWVEDPVNKAKIVDKEGNQIYPNIAELAKVDTNAESARKKRSSLEVGRPFDDLSSQHASLSSSHPVTSHPALGQEFKSVGRGRQKHRLRSHSHSLRSQSPSSSHKRSRWDKVRLRAGSTSSESSSDHQRSPGNNKHQTLGRLRRELEKLPHNTHPDRSVYRGPQMSPPDATGADADRGRTRPALPLSDSTKSNYFNRKASFSSTGSVDDRYNPRISLDHDSTAANSPSQQAGYFPSIAVNLSPPATRDTSPAKKGLRHKIASRHERSKSKQGERDAKKHDEEEPVETVAQDLLPQPSSADQPARLEPSPLPDVVSSSYHEDPDAPDVRRSESFRAKKGQNGPESKLRGIFKGPGRIAAVVGNEVSKVGDLILKKEPVPDGRKSSYPTTADSDTSDSSDDEKRSEKRSGPKALLRRLPTLGDEPSRPRHIRRDSDKGSSRNPLPSLPTFTSPLRQDEGPGSSEAIDQGSPRERGNGSRRLDEHNEPKRKPLSRAETFDFSSSFYANRDRLRSNDIHVASAAYGLTRPPVTGLAQARASPGPQAERKDPLSRAWSISGRSLKAQNDSGVPDKPEVERTRALFLSSGIKAREIIRRARTPRNPPPHWLQNSMGPHISIPRVERIDEFDLAAQNLLRRFEMTQYNFQQSMHRFVTTSSSPLRAQLKELENLVNKSLTPRVRATSDEAEALCVQLNTTSTLAVKSLSEALDRGVRRRRRRIRWARRAGFVVLEWALVGMLWWVWLVVMAFKIVRGVFRGVISGARWILWL
ncbi:hypothetical protein N7470_004807 [Penicillium chermesinum]|nr:hypothetical protein N7470_004807 [Penicillium chermesinum]